MTISSPDDDRWIAAAIEQAKAGALQNDVPVGAVVVHEGMSIGEASNRTIRDTDPTAHAEILAMRYAARSLGRWQLTGCTLYVTLEPCAMCAGAVVLARLDRLVFGAWDEKAGMVGSLGDIVRHPKLNHKAEVLGGVRADECADLLRAFFEERR
jgi:tRNA(adenine34) deaminase